MKRGRKEKLPPIPSGTEVLDLARRELTPSAEVLFATLTTGVDDTWASAVGVQRLWISALVRDRARSELERTAKHSALWHMREREVKRLAALSDEYAWNLVSALHRNVVHDWLKARPEQVLLLIQRRLEVLTDEWVSAIEAGVVLPGAGRRGCYLAAGRARKSFNCAAAARKTGAERTGKPKQPDRENRRILLEIPESMRELYRHGPLRATFR